MPRSSPSHPSKPSHLRASSLRLATPKTPPGSGAFAVPPRARVKARAVGDENDGPAENDEAYQEAVEEQKQDGEKKENENGEATNGDIVQEPEQIPMPVRAPSDGGPPRPKRASAHPQRSISKLWKNFDPEYIGRVTRILPETTAASATASSKPHVSQNAAESYREARAACEERVRKIIRECTAMNQKYTDVHFDLESDLKITRKRDCIDGLVQDPADRDDPSDVKRVTDLFENPKFFSDGAGFDDIIQGAIGDCWMMSAFSVLSSSEELIRRICVIQDQEIGVYGFVFFRDGEWHPTIIDDKLYLRTLAFDEGIENVLSQWGKDQEQKYTELFQRGSKALYFAKCRDDNETWVPLLEKAFAKAHGGYDALRGGQTGECIEDLTGGVTTELYTTNILSKEKFWKHELRRIGKDFMFDATDAMFREWQYWDEEQAWVKRIRNQRRKGVQARHAYAVLDTYEGYGEKLVKVRNPWGETEWDGAWSDGSQQWTSQWLERLDHKFGDDGVFWMSYKDFLNHYKHINRTRIFDESWYTAQKWATFQVPFSAIDYQQTKFQIEVPEDTETVVVLSQLDSRYFAGLEGKYMFHVQFRISKADDESDYIARSRPAYELTRSTNLELRLDKGTYTVLVKLEATDWSQWGKKAPEEVIRDNLPKRKEKVTTIGRLYDLAHQKGVREDEEPAVASTPGVMPPASAAEVASAEMVTPAPRSSSSHSSTSYQSGSESDSDSDSDDDREDRAPWNASCVVGLRVYSKQPDVSVKVVYPPKKVNKRRETQPKLDVDAITMAPQVEAEKNASPVEQRKPVDEKLEVKKEVDAEPPQGTMSRRPDGKAVLVERGKQGSESTEEEDSSDS